MKKKRPFHWLSNRFLLIISATLIIIYLFSTTSYSYSQPAPKTVFPGATIIKIYENKNTPSCRILPELRKPDASKKDGRIITNVVNQKMQPNNDLLQTFKCWVVLSFPQWNFEASLGGNKSPTRYWFPKIVQAEKFTGKWGEVVQNAAKTDLFVVRGGKNSILIEPIGSRGRQRRPRSSNFPTNLFAQATTDLPQTSIPSQENVGSLRYCSAISDFSVLPKTPMREKPPYEAEYGKAWGIGISDRGWDLFSQNDPCRKALQECETANQNLRNVKNPKLGTTCSISSDGIGLQPLDDSDVILTLDCSGDKEKPFSRRVIPYETQAAKINEALIKDFKKKARDDGARSCTFNIYPNVPGSLLVTPEQPKEGIVEFEADGSGEKAEIVRTRGSVEVIPIGNLVAESGRVAPQIVPHRSRYFFSGKEEQYKVEPISKETDDQYKNKEPSNLLSRPPEEWNPEDATGIRSISGKWINPWKDLGFYLSFPSGLNFPSEWKAVAESDELKTVLDYIEQKEPPLALSYVDGALARLERRDSKLASTFRGEITDYLNPKIDRRLLAVDVQSISSVQAARKSLDGSISFETVIKNYVKNLRKTRSSVVKYVSDQSFAVGNFKIWEVKAQVNLQGAYGAPKRGYKKEPAIGAGRTGFVEGTDGKPVTLIQTSYFINRQNQLFKLDFITTQEKDKLFTSNGVYTKVLESFRIVKPYQAGESGT